MSFVGDPRISTIMGHRIPKPPNWPLVDYQIINLNRLTYSPENWWLEDDIVSKTAKLVILFRGHGSEIRRSPVEVGSLSHYSYRVYTFTHPRWLFGISDPSTVVPTSYNPWVGNHRVKIPWRNFRQRWLRQVTNPSWKTTHVLGVRLFSFLRNLAVFFFFFFGGGGGGVGKVLQNEKNHQTTESRKWCVNLNPVRNLNKIFQKSSTNKLTFTLHDTYAYAWLLGEFQIIFQQRWQYSCMKCDSPTWM